MKTAKYFQIAFLAVGALTALEFIFVRGMFTWLIAVAATALVGAINVILCAKHKDWLQACLYVLTVTALCMGYFALM